MDFVEIGNRIGQMVEEKNLAYGDSFAQSGQILRILYPDGIGERGLDDMLAIVRVLDKIFRIAANRDSFCEDPWSDICGYAILAIERNLNAKNKGKG